jgi:hypothetical protein
MMYACPSAKSTSSWRRVSGVERKWTHYYFRHKLKGKWPNTESFPFRLIYSRRKWDIQRLTNNEERKQDGRWENTKGNADKYGGKVVKERRAEKRKGKAKRRERRGEEKHTLKAKLNSMVWVRLRTIPTERPPLVGGLPTFTDRGCHVVSVTDPYCRILGFLDRSRYFFLSSSSSVVLTRLSGPRSISNVSWMNGLCRNVNIKYRRSVYSELLSN